MGKEEKKTGPPGGKPSEQPGFVPSAEMFAKAFQSAMKAEAEEEKKEAGKPPVFTSPETMVQDVVDEDDNLMTPSASRK